MVWNIPAQGCSPSILSRFSPTANPNDFDNLGCLKSYNEPIQRYNRLLRSTLGNIQHNHSAMRIIYADYYAANIDILTNATQYGNVSVILQYLHACIWAYALKCITQFQHISMYLYLYTTKDIILHCIILTTTY